MTDSMAVELRSFDEQGIFEAVACSYNVVDDYGTTFLPGCFTRSLGERLPTVHFNHQSHESRMIGRVTEFRDLPHRLEIIGQLQKPSTSDWARRAWVGFRERVLTDFSIVFTRRKFRAREDGVTEFEDVDLYRVDAVMDGSVPGAKLLSFRSSLPTGSVGARVAYAERMAKKLWTPGDSSSQAIREAEEVLEDLGWD